MSNEQSESLRTLHIAHCSLAPDLRQVHAEYVGTRFVLIHASCILHLASTIPHPALASCVRRWRSQPSITSPMLQMTRVPGSGTCVKSTIKVGPPPGSSREAKPRADLRSNSSSVMSIQP